MNTARMGRLIANTTILLGLLFAVIGGLLAYAIPATPQAFVDWVQAKSASCPFLSTSGKVEHFAPAKRLIVGGEESASTPSAPAPGNLAGAIAPPVPATQSADGSPAQTQPVFRLPSLQPAEPFYVAFLKSNALRGAALGGATGLLLGLVLGIFISILDQILVAICSVWEAFRSKFLGSGPVFRR